MIANTALALAFATLPFGSVEGANSVALVEAITVAAALTLMPRALGALKEMRSVWPIGAIGLWLLLLSLIGPLSQTANATEHSLNWAKTNLVLLLALILAAASRTIPRALPTTVIAFSLGTALSVLVGFVGAEELGASLGLFAPGDLLWNPQGRLIGLAGHPNALGVTCAVSAIASSSMVMVRNRRSVRVAAAALCVINLIGLVASQSLSAIVAAAFGFVALLLLRYRTAAGLWLLVLGVLAAMVISFGWLSGTPIGDRVTTQLNPTDHYWESASGASTLDARRASVSIGLERISTSPIWGLGFDSQARASLGRTWTHNGYILALQSGGIALLTGWLAVTLWIARRSLLAIRSGIPEQVIAAPLITIFLYAISAPVTNDRYLIIPLVVWSTLMYRPLTPAQTRTQIERHGLPREMVP